MATGLETRVGFELVKAVLSDYVEQGQLPDLTPQSPLNELGIEDINLLEILNDMGISVSKYVVDFETRKIRSKFILSQVSEFEDKRGNSTQAQHLINLASYSYAPDLIARDRGCMTVGDLVSIGDYAASCPRC